jgi:tetratricopeptide (TPR) repeat protein
MSARPRAAKMLLSLALVAALAAVAAAAPAPAQKNKKTADEKNPQYQYECGVIALRYGFPDEAIRYGQKAVALDPNHFNGWNLLGNAYYGKGEFAPAAEAYEKAAAIKPDAADVQKSLGLAYVELKEPAKAEAALKKAISLAGGYDSSYYLAKLYYNERRYQESLDQVLISIRKNGSNAAGYNLKGVLLNQLGRYAEAVGSFQAGLVLTPGDINLQVNLGIALLNSGEPAKARAVFEAVLPKVEQESLRKQVEDYIKAIKDAGK